MSIESKHGDHEQPLPLRIFRCDASAEYAKRVWAHTDITFSMQCVLRLQKLNMDKTSDRIVREALWDAAIIRLFSAFDSGRYHLKRDEILDQLPNGAREGFEFFSEYRKKHIAHVSNPLDEIKAGVVLSDPRSGKKEVLAVGHMATSGVHFPDPEWVGSLGKLIEALLREIQRQIDVWRDRVLEEAKERIDDIYKFPPLRMVPSVVGYRD